MSYPDYISPRDLERTARAFDTSSLTVEERRKLANCIRRSYGHYVNGVMLFFIENRMEKVNGSSESNDTQ